MHVSVSLSVSLPAFPEIYEHLLGSKLNKKLYLFT